MARKNNLESNLTYEQYLELDINQLIELMTDKMLNFCEYYIQNSNASESARLSGYSVKTANRMGAENMTKPVIKAYLFKRMNDSKKNTIATGTEVLEFLTSVMRGEVKDQFDLDCTLDTRLNATKELFKRHRLGEKEEEKKENVVNIFLTKARKE